MQRLARYKTGTFLDYVIHIAYCLKNNLDVDAPSNLHFVSKLTEKIIMVRLERHNVHNDLQEATQSIYEKNHSTLKQLHSRSVMTFSATRTSSNPLSLPYQICLLFWHCRQTLFKRKLQNDFGMEQLLHCHKLECGALQGSVLGHRMYTICTYFFWQFFPIIQMHGLQLRWQSIPIVRTSTMMRRVRKQQRKWKTLFILGWKPILWKKTEEKTKCLSSAK